MRLCGEVVVQAWHMQGGFKLLEAYRPVVISVEEEDEVAQLGGRHVEAEEVKPVVELLWREAAVAVGVEHACRRTFSKVTGLERLR